MDHGVTLFDKFQTRVNESNRVSGTVVSRGECAGSHAAQPALPGALRNRSTFVIRFDVPSGWLGDFGCPNDLIPEESDRAHMDSVYDASTY